MRRPFKSQRGSNSNVIAKLPSYGQASAGLFVGQSTRVSTCSNCSQPIPKGEPHLIFEVLFPERKNRTTSVSFRNEQKRFHVKCIATLCEGASPKDGCADCGNSLPVIERFAPRKGEYWASVGQRFANMRICEACTQSGRWTMCEICKTWHQTSQTSVTTVHPENGEKKGVPVCERCTSAQGLRTFRTERTARYADRKINERFDRARRLLEEQFSGSDDAEG